MWLPIYIYMYIHISIYVNMHKHIDMYLIYIYIYINIHIYRLVTTPYGQIADTEPVKYPLCDCLQDGGTLASKHQLPCEKPSVVMCIAIYTNEETIRRYLYIYFNLRIWIYLDLYILVSMYICIYVYWETFGCYVYCYLYEWRDYPEVLIYMYMYVCMYV
jgi:hypothetical protein